jgi:hypothetical protein
MKYSSLIGAIALTGVALANERLALDAWRAPRQNGACASCHGPDAFDLARMGTTDATLMRRGLADGMSVEEVQLVTGWMKTLRSRFRMSIPNPLTFRPLQPGGSALPGNGPLERDIAFGRQLERLLPTLMSGRIDSLAKAQQARQEMLAVDPRNLRVGFEYPLWSSDRFHGDHFGTLNDWIADVARRPNMARVNEWNALQDAYLANPTDANFWAMFQAVETHTVSDIVNSPTSTARDLFTHKFRSQLLLTHMLRAQALGRKDFLGAGRIAFAYRGGNVLPGASMWEVGDRMRVVRGNAKTINDASDRMEPAVGLGLLGVPNFVGDSLSKNVTMNEMMEEVRLDWLWIGFTMDPGFQRSSGSNSTKQAEYLIETLLKQRLFLHNAFMGNYRLLAKGFLPEAWPNGQASFRMDYGYFWAYNRELINWNESRNTQFDPAQKATQSALWSRLVGNGFRMAAFLYIDELSKGKTVKETPNFPALERHFATYHAQHAAEDAALVAELRRVTQ